MDVSATCHSTRPTRNSSAAFIGWPWTTLSVVAYYDDTPVASHAAWPSLAEPGDMVVAMVPLTRQCDGDEDGFANFLAGAACCDKD